ncbi:skin secretory protein xP2-like [Frankliniella occidentalis]|uniref:Skin secretory protein xP2-like n=1 Tax=Frankliniella occidentalis TaxID=133901 RepID=A0A6J1SR48_FRAOC|nr:skin secretory protein xP2-like [Frankliniella occidentalis]
MSAYRRHPLEGGVGAAPRPERRGWSVIVCPRQGRRHGYGHVHHPVHLRLEATRVSGCSCEALQWIPPQHNHQDGRRPGGPLRRAPLQRAYSLERPPSPPGAAPSAAPGATPTPTPPPAHAWTAPLAPLRGHHPLAGAEVRARAMEPPSTWMPNTRRLLLEPAPCRLRGLPAGRLPYGGPALRAHASAFHPAGGGGGYPMAPRGGAGGAQAELLYGLRPSSAPAAPAAPAALALFSEQAGRGRGGPHGAPLEPPHAHGASPPSLRDAHLEPAPLLRSQVLRVLRPEELEQRGPSQPSASLSAPATPLTVLPAEEEDSAAGSAGASSDEDDSSLKVDIEKEPASPKAAEPTSKLADTKGLSVAEGRANRRQWLLRIVRENFNEQIGLLVERFVRRPRHDKSVRRVPGIGRKVNVNLQNFWKRNSGQERLMKTKDLLGVYTDSGMDWKGFQRWLTKDLQFMPSCAKLCALSLDIYQKYWSTDWDDAGTTG